MANLLFGSISPVQALLFNARDTLDLGTGVTANNLSVSTNSIVTTLSSAGLSLDIPSVALSQAGQAGLVTFIDGTHLLTGTTAGDTSSGSEGNDVIYGDAGNDRLDGRGGADIIYGGAGGDMIDGGDGNDHLYGFSPAGGIDQGDMIAGGAGSDYIQGNAGNDSIDGGDGSDRIFGGADNDSIFAGAGNDSVNGNYGDDRIEGYDGNDFLRGGKGLDVVSGGAGNDQIYGDLGADIVGGGAGADIFYFAGSDAALIDTNLLLGQTNTITDFAIGADHLSFGFVPTAIEHGVVGTVAEVLAFAQQLLDGGPSNAHEIAAITVGSDTFLVYNNSGGLLADSLIELNGVDGANLTTRDWI